MAGKQSVSVTITGNSRGLKRALDQAERDTSRFDGKMKAFGSSVRSSLSTWAPVAGAALVGFGVHAINVASDVEEAGNKIDVVFGKNAKAVKAFGEDAADTMGMSQREYLTFAGRIGALVKPMGATEEQAAEMSTTLTKLAADIGSFDNVSAEEAITALAAAMSGEMEPMKRFGVVMNDASLKAKALELGLYSGKGTLDAYAKSQAAYALIMEHTVDKQNDYIRTADGVAQKTKSAKAKFEDLTGQIGEKLMPVANIALDGMIAGLDNVTEWWDTDGQAWLTEFQAGLSEIDTWWDEDGKPAIEEFQQHLWDLGIGADNFGDRWDVSVERFRDGLHNRILPGVKDFFGMLGEGILFLGQMGQISLNIYGMVHNALNGLLSAIGSAIGWIAGQLKNLAVTASNLMSKIPGSGVFQHSGVTLFQKLTDLFEFDDGGVVPGPRGQARLAVVHGGETVLPTHKTGGMGMGGPIVVNIAGHKVAEVLLPAISDQLAKDRRAHTGSRRVG